MVDRPPRRPSIRLRVTLSVVAVVALTLGTVALVIADYALDREIGSLDADLDIDAKVVLQLYEQFTTTGSSSRLTGTGREVQVVDADGAVVFPVRAGRPELLGGDEVRSGNVTRRVPGLGLYRLRVRPIERTDDLRLVVGRSVERIYDANAALQRALLIAVPSITLALGALSWFVVGRALRPVERIRTTVSEITEHDLALRVTPPGTGDELDRLAITMNEMLDRVEEATARERQLVADASHELRSPLAAARAQLESRPSDPVEGAAHDAAAVAALTRLQALMEQLLELAKQDLSAPLPDRPVDVDDLVLRCADDLRAARPDLVVDTAAVSGGQVRGSVGMLQRMVDNLVSNAARHARGRVSFAVAEAADEVVISVADDGPGIDPADRDRVFDRFTRLDAARTIDEGGSGLGLAIVARTIELHGGSVAVVDPPAGTSGAVLEVRLPVR